MSATATSTPKLVHGRDFYLSDAEAAKRDPEWATKRLVADGDAFARGFEEMRSGFLPGVVIDEAMFDVIVARGTPA